jgi:hypothetical protein
MKRLPIYLSLIFLLTCAKEDSQNPNTPPSDITKQYTLTVSAGEGGSVSTTGGTFSSGTQVSITATPSEGYSFSGWSNGSSDNPLSVTLNSNTSVTANFQVIVNSYTLTVTAGEGGSVSSEGGEYEEGTEVTITATPDEGYQFIGWSDGEASAERVITITQDNSIEASFISIYGNYGYPSYSFINQTTGNYISNKESSGRFISRQEAVNKININNGPSEVYILADQAQALFDFDGDGDLDFFGWMVNISPATSIGYISGPGKWVWWPNYEDENSSPIYYDSPLWFAARYEMNDFNGDGILDLLWQNENHHSDGSGGFYADHYPLLITYLTESGITESEIGPPTGAHDIATGDIDNDGDIDIIEAEWHYGDCNHVSVPSFYLNDGNGNFTYSKSNLQESSLFLQNNSCTDMVFTFINLFDINGDDYLDVISGYSNNNPIYDFLENLFSNTNYNPNDIQVWYGDGSGNFSLSNGFKFELSSPVQAELLGLNTIILGGNFLDIDNDGFLELITVESYNYAGWGIRVYKNINGESFQDVTSTYFTDPIQMHSGASGPFSQQQQGDLGVSYDIQILDIDNDGDYDILPSYPSLEDEASTVKTAYFENNNGLFSLIKMTE